jgi:hypothetical protein
MGPRLHRDGGHSVNSNRCKYLEMNPGAYARLQRWFEYLGDTYTHETFEDAMAKWERGEEPPPVLEPN